MKRDMELCRKILFAIEEQYVDSSIINLKVENYSMEEVAYHCKILYDAGLIDDYSSKNADNHIYRFGVGSLTWEGHEFLDKVREESIWTEVKENIKNKGLPLVIDVVKEVAAQVIAIKLTSIGCP